MKISEIFKSIEGEGIRMGLPAIFIRFFGCNLRCNYCDTLYAVDGSDYKQMNISEIMGKVAEFKIKNITLTGGEPLIQENIESLILQLLNKQYWVNIETNGTIPCKIKHPLLFYTMDWKCKSSLMTSKMDLRNIATLEKNDVLKFVIGSLEDLKEAESITQQLIVLKGSSYLPHIFISPIFNSISNETIVNEILSSHILVENNVRFQIQLHKIIWDPKKRGV